MSFFMTFCIERHSSCSRLGAGLLSLSEGDDTCWAWWTVETCGPIKIMILFGGFGVVSKVFMWSLIATNGIIVVIFSSAVVHVLDRWQHLFFHLYSIIRRYIYLLLLLNTTMDITRVSWTFLKWNLVTLTTFQTNSNHLS